MAQMSLVIRFLISSLTIGLVIGWILFLKKRLEKHITAGMQYFLWILVFLLLLTPMIPIKREINFMGAVWQEELTQKMQTDEKSETNTTDSRTAGKDTIYTVLEADAVDKTPVAENGYAFVLIALWLSGMIVMTLFLLKEKRELDQLLQSGKECNEERVHRLLKQACEEFHIKKELRFLCVSGISSPMLCGLRKACMIFPDWAIRECDEKELYYMMLHECAHYRNRDLWWNALACAARVVYWYHPAVWAACRQMRKDCEVYCDFTVMKGKSEEDILGYGYTVLSFLKKSSQKAFPHMWAAGMGGSRKELKYRMQMIAVFGPSDTRKRVKSMTALLLSAGIILSAIPFSSLVEAKENLPEESVETAGHEWFGEKEGVFAASSGEESWFYATTEDKRESPDSTAKPVIALAALEAGVITPRDSVLEWDGTLYTRESWNGDQTLDGAMKNSVNWYFKQLDEKTGMVSLRETYEKLSYGNCDLSSGAGDYWMNGSLKISVREQIEVLKKIWENPGLFQEENVQTLKNSMLVNQGEGYRLYGKTGTGFTEDGGNRGWFIGVLERDGEENLYFAVKITGNAGEDGVAASETAFAILKEIC